MNEEKRRLSTGFAVAVGVHLVAAVIVGVLGLRFVTRPPQILEVTLAGGGGGAPQEQVEEVEDNSIVRSIDDIIDKKLKPETKKVVLKKQQKATNPNSNASVAPSNSSSSGDGTGEGSGEGTGSGSGSGSGTGDGVGDGRGVPVTPPRVASAVQPRYPSSARSRGIEGVTGVKMLVGADGRVQEAFVVRSSGNGDLDQAALDAVYKWRFTPAKDKFGMKAPCYVTQGIRFDLRR